MTTNFEAMRDELIYCRKSLLASKALNTELLAALKAAEAAGSLAEFPSSEVAAAIDALMAALPAIRVVIAKAEEEP